MERSPKEQDTGRMKTQDRIGLNQRMRLVGAMPPAPEPLVAGCAHCRGRSMFSANQVAAAQRVWELGSGQPGRAATDLLGGDGTTNQCGCGMEGEVVCTGMNRWEVQWRHSRLTRRALPPGDSSALNV